MGTEKFIAFKEDGTAYRLKGRILRFLDNEPVSEADKTNIRSTLSVPASAEGLTPANNLSDLDNAATARSNLSVNSIDESAAATGTKIVGPALYFDGTNDYVQVSDDTKLTFSSSAEFGTNSSGTWSPNDNSPALTDGTGTLNQHYRVDADAGTVTQGASTLSVINGTATTAGQAVYYDGSVWRLKDVDDLPFSISAWVKYEAGTSSYQVVSKYGINNNTREWYVTCGGSNNNTIFRIYSQASSGYVSVFTPTNSLAPDTWTFITWVYKGSGPNSGVSYPSIFSDATSSFEIYFNGVLQTITNSNYTGFTGMSNTAQPVYIGRDAAGGYLKGELRSVQIHNRSLTAAEVVQVMNGDLGFSDEWGDHTTNIVTDGDMEAAGTSNWGSGTATLSKETASPHSGSNNLKIILNGGTTGRGETATSIFTLGKRYRVGFWYRTGGTAPTAYQLRLNGSTWQIVDAALPSSAGSWTYYEVEAVNTTGTSARLTWYIAAGTDADTYIEVDDVTVHEIGILADLRAEDFNSSSGKWPDRSTNNFVGVNNGATLVGKRRHISAATLNLTSLPTSSAGLSAGEVWNNSGVLSIV